MDDLTCPNCGSENLVRHETALDCLDCGWGKLFYFEDEDGDHE